MQAAAFTLKGTISIALREVKRNPGWKSRQKIVRRKALFKAKTIFRTKRHNPLIRKNQQFQKKEAVNIDFVTASHFYRFMSSTESI
jgi:hypothetical protein